MDAMSAEIYANHGYRVRIAVGFTITITCITIFLRLLARKLKRLPLGADDYMIMLGAVFTIATALLFIPGIHNGIGRHLLTLEPIQIVTYFKLIYAAWQTYGIALTLIKISVLLFYLRIFATNSNKGFRLRVIIVGALAVGWLFAANLVAAFQCDPVKKYWLITIPGKCLNPLRCVVALHSINLALDIIILALPVAEVFRLQMSPSKKAMVAGIFSLGGLSIVIAIIRLKVILTARFEDITWYTSIHSWTAVEPAIEVLSVSLPSMAPFLHPRKLIAEMRASHPVIYLSGKSNSKNGSGGSHGSKQSGGTLDRSHDKWSSVATVSKQANDSSDQIPLHSVGMTDGDQRKERSLV